MQTAQVIPFPNPEEVTPSTTGPRRVFVEDSRVYVVYAQDETDALEVFSNMSIEEANRYEVDGGSVTAYAADN